MIARVFSCLVALGALFLAASVAPASASFDPKKYEGSVYKIYTWTPNSIGTGTGFLVSGRRIIVTNHHVVDHGRRFQIGFLEGRSVRLVEARLLETRPHLDLAVLEAMEDLPGQALAIANYEPDKLANVITSGFPEAANVKSRKIPDTEQELFQMLREPSKFDVTVTPGIVSRMTSASSAKLSDTQFVTARTVQHSAPINPGNSGGPLFDHCGTVVGVNSFSPSGAQGVFFSIHAAEVGRLLREMRIPANLAERPCLIGSGWDELLMPLLLAMTATLALAALVFAVRNRGPLAPIGQYVGRLTRMRSPSDLATRDARAGAYANWASPAGGGLSLQSTQSGRTFDLAGGRALTVGRGGQCDISIDNDTVSSAHARLQLSGQRVVVTDLGSSNGTFVNGSRVTNGQAQLGDVVRFGSAEFRLAGAAAPVAAAVGRAATARAWMLSGFDPAGRALQFELRPGESQTTWIVGRDRGRVQFVIDDSSVSGAHAQITYVPRQGLSLRDLGSTNGTKIDNEPLGGRVVSLRDTGQEIAFGAAKLRLSVLN